MDRGSASYLMPATISYPTLRVQVPIEYSTSEYVTQPYSTADINVRAPPVYVHSTALNPRDSALPPESTAIDGHQQTGHVVVIKPEHSSQLHELQYRPLYVSQDCIKLSPHETRGWDERSYPAEGFPASHKCTEYDQGDLASTYNDNSDDLYDGSRTRVTQWGPERHGGVGRREKQKLSVKDRLGYGDAEGWRSDTTDWPEDVRAPVPRDSRDGSSRPSVKERLGPRLLHQPDSGEDCWLPTREPQDATVEPSTSERASATLKDRRISHGSVSDAEGIGHTSQSLPSITVSVPVDVSSLSKWAKERVRLVKDDSATRGTGDDRVDNKKNKRQGRSTQAPTQEGSDDLRALLGKRKAAELSPQPRGKEGGRRDADGGRQSDSRGGGGNRSRSHERERPTGREAGEQEDEWVCSEDGCGTRNVGRRVRCTRCFKLRPRDARATSTSAARTAGPSAARSAAPSATSTAYPSASHIAASNAAGLGSAAVAAGGAGRAADCFAAACPPTRSPDAAPGRASRWGPALVCPPHPQEQQQHLPPRPPQEQQGGWVHPQVQQTQQQQQQQEEEEDGRSHLHEQLLEQLQEQHRRFQEQLHRREEKSRWAASPRPHVDSGGAPPRSRGASSPAPAGPIGGAAEPRSVSDWDHQKGILPTPPGGPRGRLQVTIRGRESSPGASMGEPLPADTPAPPPQATQPASAAQSVVVSRQLFDGGHAAQISAHFSSRSSSSTGGGLPSGTSPFGSLALGATVSGPGAPLPSPPLAEGTSAWDHGAWRHGGGQLEPTYVSTSAGHVHHSPVPAENHHQVAARDSSYGILGAEKFGGGLGVSVYAAGSQGAPQYAQLLPTLAPGTAAGSVGAVTRTLNLAIQGAHTADPKAIPRSEPDVEGGQLPAPPTLPLSMRLPSGEALVPVAGTQAVFMDPSSGMYYMLAYKPPPPPSPAAPAPPSAAAAAVDRHSLTAHLTRGSSPAAMPAEEFPMGFQPAPAVRAATQGAYASLLHGFPVASGAAGAAGGLQGSAESALQGGQVPAQWAPKEDWRGEPHFAAAHQSLGVGVAREGREDAGLEASQQLREPQSRGLSRDAGGVLDLRSGAVGSLGDTRRLSYPERVAAARARLLQEGEEGKGLQYRQVDALVAGRRQGGISWGGGGAQEGSQWGRSVGWGRVEPGKEGGKGEQGGVRVSGKKSKKMRRKAGNGNAGKGSAEGSQTEQREKRGASKQEGGELAQQDVETEQEGGETAREQSFEDGREEERTSQRRGRQRQRQRERDL